MQYVERERERERDGSLLYVLFFMSCGCCCAMSLPCVVIGGSMICDCSIFSSYSQFCVILCHFQGPELQCLLRVKEDLS